jgi:hypothetical protein
MASNFASEVWRSASSVSRCSSGVFAPARSPVLRGVPGGVPGLAAASEGMAALLSVEPALADGIAGIWAVLLAAQPASQEKARIVTTTEALLRIWCIPLCTS